MEYRDPPRTMPQILLYMGESVVVVHSVVPVVVTPLTVYCLI